MSTRRARPSLLLLCVPAMLAAGVALAAQQDLAQPELSAREAASTPGEAQDSLMAWPCLDAPGCALGEGAPAVAMAMQVAPQAMEPTAIPLPAALGLMGAGLTALGLLMRRRG